MRMFQVADRILAFRDIDGPVRKHLDILAMKKSVLLLGNHIGNPGLLRIEIVPDLLHGVSRIAFFHHRLAFHLTAKRIESSAGIYGSCLHVVLHIVGRKLHIAVFHGHVTIIIQFSLTVCKYLYDRIFCSGKSRALKRTLLLQRRGVDLEQRIRYMQRVFQRLE